MFQISNLKVRIFKSEKAFTLIELLLYMGIFAILLVVTVQMFTSIFDIQTESEAVSSVATDGRYIINRMTYDILQAQSINSSSSSVLTFVINGSNDSYFLSGNNILFTNGLFNATDQLNSIDTTVSSLSFTKVGNTGGKSTVQVIFTLKSNAIRRSGNETKTFQTTIGTR